MINPNTFPAKMADTDLIDTWGWIDSQRVKSGPSKGCVKLSAAKLGDKILAEARKRGIVGKLS